MAEVLLLMTLGLVSAILVLNVSACAALRTSARTRVTMLRNQDRPELLIFVGESVRARCPQNEFENRTSPDPTRAS